MKEKNEALIMMFICIVVGFSAPFLNAYIEQKAIVNDVVIPFPGLIPWQFMMLFCGLGAVMCLILYIHFDFVEKRTFKDKPLK